ncbi:DUF7472 family protein [Halegenticoccus tardaugens]|uniref:DUF7472 family protein n=1 Tax=Halegenticoccus tardaugens TaxID=2071624 RepID=UPI00100ADD1B|nr:hypothetical protein [Halegenticoccus tardaugens]
MDLEEGALQQIVVSVVAVGFFIALILAIGMTFGTSLGQSGGLALVGSIVLFIVVMALVGFFLSR